MLDLHTHILPAMDDGSRDGEETLQLLAAEKEQGVTAIAFTPHFYPHREDPARFLRRRARCMEMMQSAAGYAQVAPQKLLPGAEVAYFEGISRVEEIDRLCLGDTNAILVEMPFTRWNDRMLHDLEEFIKPGISGLFCFLAICAINNANHSKTEILKSICCIF